MLRRNLRDDDDGVDVMMMEVSNDHPFCYYDNNNDDDDDDDDDDGNDHYHDFVLSHNYSLGHLQFWICILFMGHAYPRIIATITSSSSQSSSSSSSWIQQWFKSSYEIQGFYPLRLDMIYDHYLQLISISIVFTTIFSIYL